MFELVSLQLTKTFEALKNMDQELAREVNFNEKRVNALELKIDKDCENIIALFNPVAIDLRFVLAVLKINSNLERIGDICDGISRYVVEANTPFDGELLSITRLNTMFEMAIAMMNDVKESFVNDSTKTARSVFQKDDLLDEINGSANAVLEKFIRTDQTKIDQCLERTGDQVKNIAEEIIFFLEAKVLKHTKDLSS
jgi:phosphate transport system protein